jgi:hypothetical protein
VLIRLDGQTDMTKLKGLFATANAFDNGALLLDIHKTPLDVGLCTVTGHSDHVSLSVTNLK